MSDTEAPVFNKLLEYRARLLAELERQPAQVAALLAAIPEPTWHVPLRGPAGRSLHQLAAHVRDLETLAFLPRLRRIRREERPVLEAFPYHDWSDDSYRPDEPLTHILSTWSQTRSEVLDSLPPPSSPAWARTGFHSPSGQRTLQWWAERIYGHARAHLLELGAGRQSKG